MVESVTWFAQHLFQPPSSSGYYRCWRAKKKKKLFPKLPSKCDLGSINQMLSHAKYWFESKLGRDWARDIPFAGINCSWGSIDLDLASSSTNSFLILQLLDYSKDNSNLESSVLQCSLGSQFLEAQPGSVSFILDSKTLISLVPFNTLINLFSLNLLE